MDTFDDRLYKDVRGREDRRINPWCGWVTEWMRERFIETSKTEEKHVVMLLGVRWARG